MIIAGGNFAVYYNVIHKGFSALISDFETRMYWLVLALGILITFIALCIQSEATHIGKLFQDAAFTLVSIQTGSGFAVADYDFMACCSSNDVIYTSFFWRL